MSNEELKQVKELLSQMTVKEAANDEEKQQLEAILLEKDRELTNLKKQLSIQEFNPQGLVSTPNQKKLPVVQEETGYESNCPNFYSNEHTFSRRDERDEDDESFSIDPVDTYHSADEEVMVKQLKQLGGGSSGSACATNTNFMSKPPKFCGNPIQWNNWVKNFLNYAIGVKMDRSDLIRTILSYLQPAEFGKVTNLMLSTDDMKKKPMDVLAKLKMVLSTPDHPDAAMIQLMSLVQGNMSISSFAQRIRDLVAKAGYQENEMRDKMALSVFKKGVDSDQLGLMLFQTRPGTFEEAVKRAVEWSIALDARALSKKAVFEDIASIQSTALLRSGDEMQEKLKESVKEMTEELKARDATISRLEQQMSTPPVPQSNYRPQGFQGRFRGCYNCGQFGHYQRNCPLRPQSRNSQPHNQSLYRDQQQQYSSHSSQQPPTHQSSNSNQHQPTPTDFRSTTYRPRMR